MYMHIYIYIYIYIHIMIDIPEGPPALVRNPGLLLPDEGAQPRPHRFSFDVAVVTASPQTGYPSFVVPL